MAANIEQMQIELAKKYLKTDAFSREQLVSFFSEEIVKLAIEANKAPLETAIMPTMTPSASLRQQSPVIAPFDSSGKVIIPRLDLSDIPSAPAANASPKAALPTPRTGEPQHSNLTPAPTPVRNAQPKIAAPITTPTQSTFLGSIWSYFTATPSGGATVNPPANTPNSTPVNNTTANSGQKSRIGTPSPTASLAASPIIGGSPVIVGQGGISDGEDEAPGHITPKMAAKK